MSESWSNKVLTLAGAGAVLVLCLALACAQRPRRVGQKGNSSAATNRTSALMVKAGDDLQKVLNLAQPGDTILLEAGATFAGPFTLPYKRGSGTDADWITIRTSAPDSSLPAPTERISPAYSNVMPKLVSANYKNSDNAGPALRTEARAHHYRIIGVEFAPANSTARLYDVITLGDGSEAQNSLEQVPHHLLLDRCFIHALSDSALKRGVALNSAHSSIINCFISGFKLIDGDSQAICLWNGPGPFHILNNYLEAAGENILIAGGVNWIPNLIPSDIEIRHNLMSKPLSWRASDPSFGGTAWTVKNLLELKTGKRVVVDGNILENCWESGQDGNAVGINPISNGKGAAPQIEDFVFTNNVVRHAAGGIALDGKLAAGDETHLWRAEIRNNLFEDIDGRWGETYGRLFTVNDQTDQVTIEHNTAFNSAACTFSVGEPNTSFVFRNNIVEHNAAGSGIGNGDAAINKYLPGAIWTGNVQADADTSEYLAHRSNFFPISLKAVGFVDLAGGKYRLAGTSKYRGHATDGKDPGCDFDVLSAALAWSGESFSWK